MINPFGMIQYFPEVIAKISQRLAANIGEPTSAQISNEIIAALPSVVRDPRCV
jgi:hypothetical protein